MSAKPKISVNIILDKSGSMGVVKDATISGFNEYLEGLRQDKEANYKISLTLFDTAVEKRYKLLPLKEVKNLDKHTYYPSGMTALYDAACSTIESVRGSKDKSLVVVLTDGEENSSQEYTQDNFKKLVEELEAKGNWTFVFLGAGQDAWANAHKWGFKRDNVSSFNATGAGIGATFQAMSAATGTYARSASMNTTNYFSKDQKDTMEATK